MTYTCSDIHGITQAATTLLVGLPHLHMKMALFHVSAINVYKIYLPFTRTITHDQGRGLLFINLLFPIEKNFLNSDMPHLDLDHQSDC